MGEKHAGLFPEDSSSPAYLQLLLFLKKPVSSGDAHTQGVLSGGFQPLWLHSEWGLGIVTAGP